MDQTQGTKSLYVALLAGGATFFISMSSFSRSSQNGVITSCSYTDYFALIAGIILFFYGLFRLLKSQGNNNVKFNSLAVTILGVVHIARGIGLFMSPCG